MHRSVAAPEEAKRERTQEDAEEEDYFDEVHVVSETEADTPYIRRGGCSLLHSYAQAVKEINNPSALNRLDPRIHSLAVMHREAL